MQVSKKHSWFCNFCVEDFNEVYNLILKIVPKNCGADECFYFMNEDGSVIPPAIFISYVNQNFLRNNDKVFVGVINTNDGEVDLADDGNHIFTVPYSNKSTLSFSNFK